MDYLLLTLLLIIVLLGPYPLLRLEKRWAWWSPVLACFVIGFIGGNTASYWTNTPSMQEQCKGFMTIVLNGSVLIAIPLFLMSSDLRLFKKQIGPFFMSFLLCLLAVILATIVGVFLFPDLEELPIVAGALSAVYIGGTPNMAAVLYALKAPADLSGILIATDSLCSGIYFLFLVSSAKAFYSLFLKPPSFEETVVTPTSHTEISSPLVWWSWERVWPILQAVMAAILCILFSVGTAHLFPNAIGELNELVLMLVLTSSSLVLSFWPKLRDLLGVYDFAQYLMLIFALAIGYLVDFSSLIEKGGYYLTFNGVLLALLLLFHLLLARLFRIDVDTFIMTATACIMGPPFVGAVCEAIDRRSLVAPGMTLAVIGLIAGTYIGVAITLILQVSS
ncbi:MAG: DUF819 family protein [Aureispira sp.]